jgi:MSHA biogenesis protein MshJ
MKQYLQKLALRLDARSLRERVLIFGGVALILVFLLIALLLDPQFDRQKKTAQQIKQDQDKIAAMQLEIQQKVQSYGIDQDQVNREKLKQLRQQSLQLRGEMMGMQRNLVAPEKMPLLLEDILKRNGKLRLISLKNLPMTNLVGTESKEMASAAKAGAKAGEGKIPATSEAGLVFWHGVEIVVQGSYADMVNYLTALETMPWEVYWGNAKFQVETYPVSTLTLTLYTLSLDKSWLNL